MIELDLSELSELIRTLAFSLVTAYVIGVRKYNLVSISQSDYKLQKMKFLFEVVMVVGGLSVIFSSGLTDNDWAKYFLIAGGILLGGVGVFPAYRKNKFNETMHVICAIGGFFFTWLGIFVMSWMLGALILVALIIALAITKGDRNNVLTLELVLIYGIFISLEILSI